MHPHGGDSQCALRVLFNRKSYFGGATAEICSQADGKIRLYYGRSGTNNYKINSGIHKGNGFDETIKAAVFLTAIPTKL